MKIALLILFIGASNALPAPQFPDFGEMDRQIAQQMADVNRQVAGINQQVQEQMAGVNQQVQQQISYAQNQVAEAQRQAADAAERARQLSLQNQGNTMSIIGNGGNNQFGNHVEYSYFSRQESFVNGVRTCTETRSNRVTGQLESFTC